MSSKTDHLAIDFAIEQIQQHKLTGAFMGQYWKPVNLTKREYIHPHRLGDGLKLLEQASSPNTAAALTILLAAMPQRRGGGDFQNNPFIGRWAGDKIAFAGDYSEDSDMPSSPIPFGVVYHLCSGEGEVEHNGVMYESFTDVTDDVLEIMQAEGLTTPAEQPF